MPLDVFANYFAGAPGGEGAVVSVPPEAIGAIGVLDLGDAFSLDFEIGLERRSRFDFFVDAYGVVMDGVNTTLRSTIA